jgi:phospholipase C
MTGHNKDKTVDRRGFLRAMGGASTVAVAVAAAPIAATEALAATPEQRKARYQETDHVKAYYRTNRY